MPVTDEPTIAETAHGDLSGPTAACCAVTDNYLPHALCLESYLQEHEPGLPLVVLVVGRRRSLPAALAASHARWLFLEDVVSPDVAETLARRYTPVEISCAVRGDMHRFMCEQSGYERWVMLDTDLAILSPLAPLWEAMGDMPMLLTVHTTMPVPGPRGPVAEAFLIDHGIYNGGVVAMRRSPEAARAITWFTSRLHDLCYTGDARHVKHWPPTIRLFLDQKWLSLIPVFFPQVSVVRDETLNLGHWNLFQGTLTEQQGRFFFDGRPVTIAHLSAIPKDAPETVSRFTDMYRSRPNQAWAKIAREYLGRVERFSAAVGDIRYSYADVAPRPKTARLVARICRGIAQRLEAFAGRLGP